MVNAIQKPFQEWLSSREVTIQTYVASRSITFEKELFAR